MLGPTIWRGSSAWTYFLIVSLLAGQLRLSIALKLQELHGDGPDPVLTGCADFLWVQGFGLYERYKDSGKTNFHYASVDGRDGALRHLKWQPNSRYENPTLPGSYGKWELGNFDAGEYDTSKVFAKLENSLKCPQGSFKLTVEDPRANDPEWVKVYPYTSRDKIYLDNALRRLTMGNLFTNEFTDSIDRIANGIIAVLCYEHDAYHHSFNQFQVGHAMKEWVQKESFMGFTKIALLFGISGVELNDKLAGRAEEAISKILGILDHALNVGLGSYYIERAFHPNVEQAINASGRIEAPDTIAADAAHFVITKNDANDSTSVQLKPDVAHLSAPSQDPMGWVNVALPNGLAAVELAMRRANLSILAKDVHQAVGFAKAATNATVMRWLPGGEGGTGVSKPSCSKINAVWLTVWNALQMPILDYIGIFRARSFFSDGRTLWQQWFVDKSWWDTFFGEGKSSWDRGLENVRKYTGRVSRIRSPKDNPGDDKTDDTESSDDEPKPGSQDDDDFATDHDDQATDGGNAEEQKLLDTPV